MKKSNILIFIVLIITIFLLCSSAIAEDVDLTGVNEITVTAKVDSADIDKDAIYQVITDFINKLASKNFEGMFENVSLNYGAKSESNYDMFKKNMENGLFKFLRDPAVVFSGCGIIDINKLVINNDVADFYLDFSCKGSDSSNINETERIFKKIVRVAKENGTWKISEWQSNIDNYLPEIKETVKKFINSIYSNNIDEAIACVSSRYIDQMGDYSKFKEEIRNRFSSQPLLMSCDNFIIKKYSSFFDDDISLFISFECKEIKEESALGTVNKEIFFSLKKEGNVWKISGSSLLNN